MKKKIQIPKKKQTSIKKKLQIFISSTFIDLQEERQAAVEAILSSNNIPAGMELFQAGNNSQLETIKKWINESDIYMLILGGRYGSIEPDSGKSYTQLEYEYALNNEIPVFAVVLSDGFLKEKATHSKNIYEKENKYGYAQFKELVMKKMIKTVDDRKDIKLAIFESIAALKEEYDFQGWTRGMNDSSFAQLLEQNDKLLQEIKELKELLNANPTAQKANDSLKMSLETKYILKIEGIKKASGEQHSSQIEMTLLDIFTNLAPLMMNAKKTVILKYNFENRLLNKYFQNYRSLVLEDEHFQNIKMQMYAMQLITIIKDEEGNELTALTPNGFDLLHKYDGL